MFELSYLYNAHAIHSQWQFVVLIVFGVMHAAAVLLATDGMSSAKAALGQILRENPSPKISKSDEDFERMGVEFVWGYQELNLDDLNDLFSRVSPPWCWNFVTLHLLAESNLLPDQNNKGTMLSAIRCTARHASVKSLSIMRRCRREKFWRNLQYRRSFLASVSGSRNALR